MAQRTGEYDCINRSKKDSLPILGGLTAGFIMLAIQISSHPEIVKKISEGKLSEVMGYITLAGATTLLTGLGIHEGKKLLSNQAG